MARQSAKEALLPPSFQPLTCERVGSVPACIFLLMRCRIGPPVATEPDAVPGSGPPRRRTTLLTAALYPAAYRHGPQVLLNPSDREASHPGDPGRSRRSTTPGTGRPAIGARGQVHDHGTLPGQGRAPPHVLVHAIRCPAWRCCRRPDAPAPWPGPRRSAVPRAAASWPRSDAHASSTPKRPPTTRADSVSLRPARAYTRQIILHAPPHVRHS